MSVRDTVDRVFPWCAEWYEPLQALFARYVETKQTQSVLDYDDLLLYWSQMMQVEEMARFISARFDHVFVDEYQDTNELQASLLLGLKPDGTGLTVVGDDAQAIYAFRSATVRNILDLPGRFDPLGAVIRLRAGSRSTITADQSRGFCGMCQRRRHFASPGRRSSEGFFHRRVHPD